MKQLNDMALFVEVVKAMNFRRAADAINMPSSTLSRRISALEKSIGLRLLQRTTRKIELTEAGLIYFERCKRIVDEANLAHEQLRDMLAQPSGTLRVSLPVDFSIAYLAPLIVEFAKQYPHIHFDLDTTPRKVDLVGESFDIAIRMGKLENSPLIAKMLTKLPTCLYASPQYLKQHGSPNQPDDLTQFECLYILKSNIWLLKNGEAEHYITANGRFSINSIGMVKRLATLGMGIALLPSAMVVDDMANGTLQQILPQWQGLPIPVYALTETRLLPAKTQRFIEFLYQHLSHHNVTA